MRISFATKIFLLFLVASLPFLGVSLYATYQIEQQRSTIALLNEAYLPLIKSIAQIETIAENQTKDAKRLFDAEDQRIKKILSKLVARYFPRLVKRSVRLAKSRLDHLRKHSHLKGSTVVLDATSSELERIAKLEQEIAEISEQILNTITAGAEESEKMLKLESRLGELVREVQKHSKLAGIRVEQSLSAMLLAVERQGNRTLLVVLVLLAMSIALSGAVVFLILRAIKPIKDLAIAAQRISGGDYSTPITVNRSDEIGALAEEFDKMRQSLLRREEELARQREQLLRSERLAAVGRMAAHVAHEIRNPLSSISLNAELLMDELERLGASEDARATLAAILRETERLSNITEEYLQFARQTTESRKRFDLVDATAHVVELMRPAAAEKGVQIEFLTPNHELTIVGNENRVIQAILNLVKNAIEAAPTEHGTVHIEVSTNDAFAVVRVQDNGKGLPQDVPVERLYDPFFSTKPDGTGLGLPLTLQVAEEHGGALIARNTKNGAEFLLKLPLAD